MPILEVDEAPAPGSRRAIRSTPAPRRTSRPCDVCRRGPFHHVDALEELTPSPVDDGPSTATEAVVLVDLRGDLDPGARKAVGEAGDPVDDGVRPTIAHGAPRASQCSVRAPTGGADARTGPTCSQRDIGAESVGDGEDALNVELLRGRRTSGSPRPSSPPTPPRQFRPDTAASRRAVRRARRWRRGGARDVGGSCAAPAL